MKGLTRHLSYANVAATAALVLAMTGGAIAASGGFTSGGKLQACVNEEGAIRLLKAGKHCRRGQKTVTWNQVGPAGPKGATGGAGPAGPAGATGPSGQPTNVMWAQIGAEGTIEATQGVTRVEDSGTSPFTVTFERDLTSCAVVATQNSSVSSHTVRTAKIEGSKAKVSLEDEEGKPTANPFSIVAVC